IATGPGGDLWFTEYSAGQIGSLGTSGTFQEIAVPTAAAQPFAIASGAGSIWFTEQAGNSVARASMITDTTAPTITLAVPADGATYTAGSVVQADFACEDEVDGSGIASCAAPVSSGAKIDTSVGTHSFTVKATDVAGNTSSVTSTYIVPD